MFLVMTNDDEWDVYTMGVRLICAPTEAAFTEAVRQLFPTKEMTLIRGNDAVQFLLDQHERDVSAKSDDYPFAMHDDDQETLVIAVRVKTLGEL